MHIVSVLMLRRMACEALFSRVQFCCNSNIKPPSVINEETPGIDLRAQHVTHATGWRTTTQHNHVNQHNYWRRIIYVIYVFSHT